MKKRTPLPGTTGNQQMQSMLEYEQRFARVRNAPRASLSRRVGMAAAILTVLWSVLAPFHASFANDPGSSVGQGPRRQVVAPDDPAKMASWKKRWQTAIISAARARYCDKEMGEEIGWLISPLLNGFYYGYLATTDVQWVDRFVDWTDAWINRGIAEPDGHVGWPKVGAAGTDVDDLSSYYADSLVGEAMALRPVVLMSALIVNLSSPFSKPGSTPSRRRYGPMFGSSSTNCRP